MDSVHHSRGRIFFEVLCALGMSASFVEAAIQTYAPALLPAAAIAALYSVVRAFDMRRPKLAATAAEVVANASSDKPNDLPLPALREAEPVARDTEIVAEPEPLPQAKPQRKARKPKAPQAAPASEVLQLVPPRAPETERVETAPEPDHAPIAPLFEPEPFLRTHRAAFGRKSG